MSGLSEISIDQVALKEVEDGRKQGLAAIGGILGAFAATSCCILPLALTLFGVSGAWMSNLTALAPYQPFIIAVTLASLGYGAYLVYWKPNKACADGSACARPLPNKLVIGSLWLATVVVVVATTFGLWFPIMEPYLP